jgi:hypothetical protein
MNADERERHAGGARPTPSAAVSLKELILLDLFRALSSTAQNGVLRIADDLARLEQRRLARRAARHDLAFQIFLRRAGVPPRG